MQRMETEPLNDESGILSQQAEAILKSQEHTGISELGLDQNLVNNENPVEQQDVSRTPNDIRRIDSMANLVNDMTAANVENQ